MIAGRGRGPFEAQKHRKENKWKRKPNKENLTGRANGVLINLPNFHKQRKMGKNLIKMS